MDDAKKNRIIELTKKVQWEKEILDELEARVNRYEEASVEYNLAVAEYHEQADKFSDTERELNNLVLNFRNIVKF
jgi:uncharacterized coiled-coil DUF342 family protein